MLPPLAHPGTHVFVDGFNFFDALGRCFGAPTRNDFYLPDLADLLCERAALPPVTSIKVYIGTLNENLVSKTTRQFWRDRLPALRAQERIEVKTWPNQPRWRFNCQNCSHKVGLCARCQHAVHGQRSGEKGIDVAFALGALEAALLKGVDNFIFFTQDADQAPLIEALKTVIPSRGGFYTLFCAFPTCNNTQDHDHGVLPGTRKLLPSSRRPGLPFDLEDFLMTARTDQ